MLVFLDGILEMVEDGGRYILEIVVGSEVFPGIWRFFPGI